MSTRINSTFQLELPYLQMYTGTVRMLIRDLEYLLMASINLSCLMHIIQISGISCLSRLAGEHTTLPYLPCGQITLQTRMVTMLHKFGKQLITMTICFRMAHQYLSETLTVIRFGINPGEEGNHSALVSRLGSKDIISAYHQFYGKEQGKEEHATLYMYRHQDKPYHVDYCFASACFMEKLD